MRSTRREFLGTAAMATGAMAIGTQARAEETRPVKLGVIGVGWYGMVDAEAALKAGGAEVVGVCDVDSEHLTQNADRLQELQGKRPATFKQYEQLLDMDGLDAVIIGSPPHWHALQLIGAIDRGLDVYCEKPLAYDVRECLAMADAVKNSDRVVQVGFQRRQSDSFKQVKQAIDDGAIGRLVQIDAQIHYKAGLKDNTPTDPPAALDWDMWCGPGPKIPYSEQVGHKSWRLEKTSGHGHLVDWGIHWIDACRMILGEGMPKSVTAVGGLYQYKGRITTPDTLTAHFEFERCPVVWRHRLWGSTEYPQDTKNGIFFYGDQGTIFATDRKWMLLQGRNEPVVHEAPSDMGTNHMADFLQAVRTRGPVACSVEEGCKSTATVKLAMIAYDTQSQVTWDDAGRTIAGDENAAALLKRDYRAPYRHPYA